MQFTDYRDQRDLLYRPCVSVKYTIQSLALNHYFVSRVVELHCINDSSPHMT